MLNKGSEDAGLQDRLPSSLGSIIHLGCRHSEADYFQHLWVEMLHLMHLIKVPKEVVETVKQKAMHVNSLH